MIVFSRREMAVRPDASNPVTFASMLLVALGLLRAAVDAQGVSVVPTVLDGNPFRGDDVRSTFTTGDKISLNIIVDTRRTPIQLDAVTVTIRFPQGILRKLIRRPFEPPGTGWPTPEGVPLISSATDLPEAMQPLLGSPFLVISGSAENEECPCDEDNGAGMEAVVHFLLVDLQREVFLAPGVYPLFQTDWVVTEDCDVREFSVEITDGPREGLRGLGKPARTFLVDDESGLVFGIGSGLRTQDSSDLRLRCRRDLTFIRGDVNVDGQIDVTDAVGVLTFLFLGYDAACEAAADADGSELVEITDSIFLLRFLFLAGKPVPAPYPGCGVSPVETMIPCRRICTVDEPPR